MELFSKEFVLKLNTKNLGNSTSLPTTTQMAPSTKWFRENKILTIDVAAEFCPWIKQPQNGSSISDLGLAEILLREVSRACHGFR
jgi:hypothetical protein